MPDAAVYYFCRNAKCGHFGQFISAPDTVILCPRCDRPMVRQDVAWTKVPTGTWDTPKDAA
jgi:hypothetical protein